ncbi:MAG: ATP synthase F0 subunit B [Akkermansia sp.]
MLSPILAMDVQALFDRFGIHTDAFIAHSIAFIILAVVVVKFGIKPIAAQLEERRKRIEEGEAMRAESERVLADVKESSKGIVAEARDQAQVQLEKAKEMATRLQDEAATKAAADARTTLDNAAKQAEFEAQQQREALRADFTRLVAAATSQVTGKVLSEEDHARINEEAIAQL